MAAIGAELMGRVLGHSDAEKAFRPWWDKVEDNLIYMLVLVGIIVVPTAIIMGTPLDCTYCQADYCGEGFINNGTSDPGFNAWFVKKVCTLNGSVEPFMLYFPYFLLFIALVLWCIERAFLKIFQADIKLDTFYNFLVKENILPSKDKENKDKTDCTDGGREAIEISQSFKTKNNYFLSYVVRTSLEIALSGILLVWMCWKGLPKIEHQDTINCQVHDFWYECSGTPAQFYIYVLYITVALTSMYFLLNCYNFVWLVFPCFSKLSRLMRAYKYEIMLEERMSGRTDKQVMGELYNLYFKNRDMRLLLDLLCSSSGIAPALAIMMIFDKKFGDAMKPKIIHIDPDFKLGFARVEFTESRTGVRAALARLPDVNLVYVAEIIPPADYAAVGFEFKELAEEDGDGMKGDVEMSSISAFGERVQAAVFTGLKPDVDYTIKVSTIVNGRSISQMVQAVSPLKQTVPLRSPRPPQKVTGSRVSLEKEKRQSVHSTDD